MRAICQISSSTLAVPSSPRPEKFRRRVIVSQSNCQRQVEAPVIRSISHKGATAWKRRDLEFIGVVGIAGRHGLRAVDTDLDAHRQARERALNNGPNSVRNAGQLGGERTEFRGIECVQNCERLCAQDHLEVEVPTPAAVRLPAG